MVINGHSCLDLLSNDGEESNDGVVVVVVDEGGKTARKEEKEERRKHRAISPQADAVSKRIDLFLVVLRWVEE